MKAYKIFFADDAAIPEIVAAENEAQARGLASEKMEIDEIRELCDLVTGCICDFPVWEKGEDETTCPEYITEGGETICTGSPILCGDLDIERTDAPMIENDDCPFSEWEFVMLIGTYWDGSNWRVVAIQKYA